MARLYCASASPTEAASSKSSLASVIARWESTALHGYTGIILELQSLMLHWWALSVDILDATSLMLYHLYWDILDILDYPWSFIRCYKIWTWDMRIRYSWLCTTWASHTLCVLVYAPCNCPGLGDLDIWDGWIYIYITYLMYMIYICIYTYACIYIYIHYIIIYHHLSMVHGN